MNVSRASLAALAVKLWIASTPLDSGVKSRLYLKARDTCPASLGLSGSER